MKTSILVLSVLSALFVAEPGRLLASDLYTGETVVEFDTLPDAGAFRRALAAVILKHTGNKSTARNAALLDAAGDPEKIVLSYQFRELEIPRLEDEPESQRRLVAEFDPPTIDRLLAGRGVPRWGRERPALLVWLVLSDEEGTRFLPPEAKWLQFALADGVDRYGLEFVYPLMDTLDLSQVRVDDVRAGELSGATDSAERYGADGVLLVDFRQGPQQWSGRWHWQVLDREDHVSADGQTPERAVAEGLARLARQLADSFSVTGTPSSPRRQLIVSGLKTEAQFAEVLAYLRGLSMIDRVRIQRAQADQVVFELDLGAGGLESALSFSRLLEEAAPDPESFQSETLEYRLRW